MTSLDFKDSHTQSSRPPIFNKQSSTVKENLRGWSLGLPAHVSIPSADLPTMIAVGGGKGGVGKSILSANLAAKLSQNGFRVLVVDLDLGCANLHTHFGIPKPEFTLSDFIINGNKSFAEIITPTKIAQVALVAGGQEAAWGRQLAGGPETLSTLWTALLQSREDFQVDFIVMDLGAGTLRHTMDFFATAHLGIMAVLPEPTSLENAYVFLKTHIWHIIENVGQRTNQQEAAADVRAALSQIGSGSFASGYAECFRKMSMSYPEFISDIFTALHSRTVGLVINQARSQQDIDIGTSMELICRRYFGIHSQYLGYLNYDDSAWKSLRNRRLLLTDFPHSILSKRLTKVTNQALSVLGY
jgi:flagellar biosynthesis protein FlhG